MTDQTQAPARVTLEDVRAAIAGTDPTQTNAAKVRSLLGRGSFETIQKHLGALRAEVAAASAPPSSADQVPPVPQDAAAAMWHAAYSAAAAATLRRTEALAAERDAALLRLDTMSADVAELVATVDSQAEQVAAAAAAKEAAEAAHLADLEKAQAEQTSAAQELASVRAELDRTRADAAHVAELAKVGRESLSQELARLTDQVAELKAALYKRAESAAQEG